ncbi:hypothetical protein DRE_02786 [Drechslerella stenobrocha 248]|uniref:Protein unc-45 homolog B n=1 Tax=Drechslerella stenobrocha 248 TaxID=1043628 RepID=W7HWH9_9PEZI|nr:hypothetical protein DRE_02786 [Drechslerella stenobrocha 248]
MGDKTDNRAALLASTGLGLFNAGRLEDAARALREAIHLAPDNPQVRAAFQHIQNTQSSGSRIPELCAKLLEDAAISSGEEAVKIIHAGGSLTGDQAKAVVLAVLQYDGEDEKVRVTAGKMLAALVQTNADARTGVAAMIASAGLRERIFDRALQMGAEGVDALASVVLDAGSWEAGQQQDGAMKGFFRHLLAQLDDAVLAEASIRAVSRLLAAEATRLQLLVGKGELVKLLGLIDGAPKEQVRTGALLATAKYLECIESRISSGGDEDMALAFNVAAALFPVATSSLTNLFQTEGFVQNLVPSLHGRPQPVELAAINLLSAACIDKTCREAVSKHCEEYLKSVSSSQGEGGAAAALALAKLSGDTPSAPAGEKEPVKPANDKEIEALAAKFTKLLSTDSDASKKLQPVEGLAYTSLTPAVKESIAADKTTVKSLLGLLTPTTPPSILFGVLTTLDNLSRYTKPLTEEQLKMAQLKNYANAAAQKNLEIHKLDTDPYVTKRCKALLDAGVIPALVRLTKKTSPQATALTASILLSLSKVTAHRGLMAQQGAVRLLLQIYASLPTIPTAQPAQNTELTEEPPETTIHAITAHALSRLLISVNPTLAFSASLPIASAVPPILTLIKSVHTSTAETRDLLPLFEGLLALTNLASTTDSIRAMVVRQEFATVEELLVYRNDMVQRAAVELVCNLMVGPETVALFAEGARSGNRVQILLAVAVADDVPSRLAAGGALAMLTEWDAGAKKVLEREGAVERLLEMCGDEEEGVVFRAVVVLRNILAVGGGAAREKIKAAGAVEVLKGVLEKALAKGEKSDLAAAVVETLQQLM